jgi:hypothetical protein
MPISDRAGRLLARARPCLQVLQLPRARPRIESRRAPAHITRIFVLITKLHPRFRLIKNKTIGMALIHLRHFKTPADYLATVKKRDGAAYYGKRESPRLPVSKKHRTKSLSRGYAHHPHLCPAAPGPRDGMPFPGKENAFCRPAAFHLCRVVDKDGKLMAYCNYGNGGICGNGPITRPD